MSVYAISTGYQSGCFLKEITGLRTFPEFGYRKSHVNQAGDKSLSWQRSDVVA